MAARSASLDLASSDYEGETESEISDMEPPTARLQRIYDENPSLGHSITLGMG